MDDGRWTMDMDDRQWTMDNKQFGVKFKHRNNLAIEQFKIVNLKLNPNSPC